MPKYRSALPQLGNDFFMSDGGIETTLIFQEGLELPLFAAFHLLKSAKGEEALRKYFRTYALLARKYEVGLILETASWRSNPDWGSQLGYSREDLRVINKKLVQMLEEVRSEYETGSSPIVISGCLGPRGDGYIPDQAMTVQQAENYHQAQVEAFFDSSADLVTAITMNYFEEAAGIALAAQRLQMPVVISFTVETDGKLPTGQPLGDALEQIDDLTSAYPAYYMINCAHPSHFANVLSGNEPWIPRIRGLRANASKMSHAELNESTELDPGNPTELGREYAELKLNRLKQLNVMGGCCGTDERHVEQMTKACLPLFG